MAGEGGAALRDATTGDMVAEASSAGIDFAAALTHARERGGPALREMTFHERAGLLKALAKRLLESKEELYALSYRTGATRDDSWIDIDGGIGTVFAFAGKGARELPNERVYRDGGVEGLSKAGTFVGQHVYLPREGAAVHINAFNFPVWGMLEKLAPAILAGVPAIVKPATTTAYLAELLARRIIESGILPRGCTAVRVRQPRRSVRSPHVSGCRVLHRVGAHGRTAAGASIGDCAIRAVHRGDRFAQLQHPRRGFEARNGGIRPVHPGGGARDDGQDRSEMHRHPQGAGAGVLLRTT